MPGHLGRWFHTDAQASDVIMTYSRTSPDRTTCIKKRHMIITRVVPFCPKMLPKLPLRAKLGLQLN